MVFDEQQKTANLRELQLLASGLQNQISGSGGILSQLTTQSQQLNSLLNTRANAQPTPVGNLLYNGELGHSVNSWFDSSYIPNDLALECAFYYTNNAPANAQTFTTISVANQIPLPGHNFTTGTAVRFTTTGTLPTTLALATNYYVIVINANVISVAATNVAAFTPVAVTINAGTGSGTHTIAPFLYTATAATDLTNKTLQTTAHTSYNSRYSKWISSAGEGALTGTMTIDAQIPTNWVDATVNLARVSMICARSSPYIELPTESLFGCGIWDDTVGQTKFIEGDIGFFAVLDGATGGTTRKFKALLSSDRGYQLLSSEITIANAPPDGGIDPPNAISMGWRPQSGQLQVDIYEHYDPGGVNEFRLIAQVSSATSFIYTGNVLQVVSGYPTPTGTVRTGTFFTQPGDLTDMAINSVAAAWDTCNFPITVPNNYNKANTTGRQWVRIWLTVAPNMVISGVTSNGATPTHITSPVALFTSEYSAIYASSTLVVQFYQGGVLKDTDTIAARVSDTELTLVGNVAAGTYDIRIVAGGFHGVLVDKIHLGFQQNTAYTPNANDNRTLQPVAAPTQSDQGGTGTGGDGGGLNPNCVAIGTPIKLLSGEWHPVETRLRHCGERWDDGGVNGNILVKLVAGFDYVRRVRSANGIEIYCTDSERFVVDADCVDGKPLAGMRVGDYTMTEVDGRKEKSRIIEISELLERRAVYTPRLSNTRYFIAGSSYLRWWQKVFYTVWRRRKPNKGYILHNRKNDNNLDV